MLLFQAGRTLSTRGRRHATTRARFVLQLYLEPNVSDSVHQYVSKEHELVECRSGGRDLSNPSHDLPSKLTRSANFLRILDRSDSFFWAGE